MPTTVEKEIARAYHALVKAMDKATKRYSVQCQDTIMIARGAVETALSMVRAEQKGGEAI